MEVQEIVLTKDRSSLELSLSNGEHHSLTAVFLKENARDAASRQRQLQNQDANKSIVDHANPTTAKPLKIESVRPMGSTGINIRFSDGHYTAIYPFVYLAKLCRLQ